MFDVSNCELTRYPSKVLATKSAKIDKIDDNIKALAEKMIDIMVEAEGIGLAGPQAGVGLQIFVISLDGTREKARVYINPVVEGFGSMTTMQEGCLSFPKIFVNIKRHSQAKVRATDLDGNEFTEEADGLYAKCLQHEYDHLIGITIADRMGRLGRIKFRKELNELRELYGQK